MEKEYGTEIFLSRELSWLDFNSRVLDESACKALPLLERLKFIAIFSSNLDEFFMVRVAGLRHAVKTGDHTADPAGLTAQQQLQTLHWKLDKLLSRQHRILYNDLLPELEKKEIRITSLKKLPGKARKQLKEYFRKSVLPVLTPLAVDPSHPFPVLNNGVIELAVHLKNTADKKSDFFAFVEVPEVLDRFIAVDDKLPGQAFVLLEELIESELPELFTGCKILESFPFRITRDMDFAIEEECDDLLRSVELNLLERRSREPIRLEVSNQAGGSLRNWLAKEFELDASYRYTVKGMLNLKALFELIGKINRPDLLEKPWLPVNNVELPENENIFESITKHKEILLAVPFQKFDPVIRLLAAAADDPAVLAIKQTLYRVSGDSPVVAMLARAAANGKQVTVIVELKARFDEGNNIVWARRLEEAGAHVVYGISGLKIHCKSLLIVRKEKENIKRYVHLGTGNYNDKTARLYTDLSIFSDDEPLCEDVSRLFNIITGNAKVQINWSKIAASPFDMRWKLSELIEREIANSTPERPGRIIAKMNSLTDPDMIRKLYAAADAGVKIDLIVRGICCLQPHVGNDNINVISIVDRYLEHSRIYYFANGGNEEFYLSSADFMTRNLDRRIEMLFPVIRQENCQKLKKILAFELNDKFKSRVLKNNGKYTTARNDNPASRSQQNIYNLFMSEVKADSAATVLKVFAKVPTSGKE
ncbi:MAG: polyphosphate kinase 1 [Lentisphaerae bacterium]|nr:polyphosphate kinase 1 [Lentisphaerota bacterium]